MTGLSIFFNEIKLPVEHAGFETYNTSLEFKYLFSLPFFEIICGH